MPLLRVRIALLILFPRQIHPPMLPLIHSIKAAIPGALTHTTDFLLTKMAGFMLAMFIRWLYNYVHTPSLESVPYREEAWPSTHWAFMLIVPLAGVLQLVINMILARFGW